jgi:hypothetical protein
MCCFSRRQVERPIQTAVSRLGQVTTCHLYLDVYSSILSHNFFIHSSHFRDSDFIHATTDSMPILSTSPYVVISPHWPPCDVGTDTQSFSQPSLSLMSYTLHTFNPSKHGSTTCTTCCDITGQVLCDGQASRLYS